MINALVTAETLVLAITLVMVVGLLRAYGELRREVRLLREDPVRKEAPVRSEGAEAPSIAGVRLDRSPVALAFGGGRPNTLLAFLSSGCLICHGFWDDLREGNVEPIPGIDRIVVVTKSLDEESPSKLTKLAPRDGEPIVVTSSQAWEDYAVPGAPYFIYVDGANGLITGEGSARNWQQIGSLIVDATADGAMLSQLNDRVEREDGALAAAGIGPGHPSLYDPAYENPAEDGGGR